MHIATGFLSPPVWGTMAAVGAGVLAGSLALARRAADDRRVPLMGVMGAFVFAAQMVNFPVPLVPGTSGHLGGGFLLGVLLGAPSGVIIMTSVLVVQALVFQDGGLEALGANVFNMGIIGCFLGGLVRQVMLKRGPGLAIDILSFLGAVVTVVAGATSAVFMLGFSGSLPSTVSLGYALVAMDAVHLPIGVIEGLVSVAVIRFVMRTRAEAVFGAAQPLSLRRAA
jgi:cobalt/nickel transport system permease protein